MATVIVGVFGIQWIRRGGPVPNDGNGGPPPPELILVERWQPSVWVEVDGVGVKLIPEGSSRRMGVGSKQVEVASVRDVHFLREVVREDGAI